MRFKIRQKDFLEMVYRAQSIVERKTTLPILSHVLIETKEGKIFATSTDLEMSLQESKPADIEELGSIVVPVVLLHEILKKLPQDSDIVVSKSQDESLVHVKSGNSRFKLPSLDITDFPNIQIPQSLNFHFDVHPTQLLNSLDMVRFSICSEESRYNLSGVFFDTNTDQEKNKICLVTSDGHRLTHSTLKVNGQLSVMPEFLISKKMCQELFSIVEKTEDQVQVFYSENQIVLKQKDLMFSSRLVDATFPDYKNMIPVCSQHATLNAKDFLNSLERLSPLVNDRSPHVHMSFSNDNLKLLVPSENNSEATDEIYINYNGPSISLILNLRYLLEIVSRLKETEMQISFETDSTPVIISDMQDLQTYCVLMPMRG